MPQFSSPFQTKSLPSSPIEDMAEALREAQEAKGFSDTHDLLVLGFPQGAIDRFGPEAVVLARRNAERQVDPEFRRLARAA